MSVSIKTALTIAGTDPSGGAGLHADLKTFAAHGVYGMGAVTAVVSQNTLGVRALKLCPARLVQDQIAAVFEDIPPGALKVGMIGSPALARAIAHTLVQHSALNLVIDPVLVATSGHALSKKGSLKALVAILLDRLIPIATLVTPNVPEGEALSGRPIRDKDDMLKAAAIIRSRTGCAVLLKGGHIGESCDDLLLDADGERWFEEKRIDTKDTHGTGCTLSAAITSNLANGHPLDDSIRLAKDYLTGALAAGLRLGKGSGPVFHGWRGA